MSCTLVAVKYFTANLDIAALVLDHKYRFPIMFPFQGIVDNSGLRLFYTAELREYDTGMLLFGSEVNFLHVVPPREPDFMTVGRCTSECTEKALGSGGDRGGIKLLNGVLHSHLAGRKIRLR